MRHLLLVLLAAAGCVVPAGAQEEPYCTRSFGCHNKHGKTKKDCPGCKKSLIPEEDALCTRCSIREKVCKHCGRPRGAGGKSAPSRPDDDLWVMSYNIRYLTANDGPNHWNHRKDICAGVVTTHMPDLVGMQECVKAQRDYFIEKNPLYEGHGVPRTPSDQDEQSCILYRADRIRFLEGGTFWLSQTPEKVASRSWDSSMARICTWGRFQTVGGRTKRTFYMFNTHFDNSGKQSRLEAAKLIRQRISDRKFPDDPVIVTGDFNATENSDPVKEITKDEPKPKKGEALKLIDTYKAINGNDGFATHHGFRGGKPRGGRIDHIFVTPDLQIIEARIDYDNTEGRYPSDHFPVSTHLKFKK